MSDYRTILMVDDVPLFRDLVALFLARTARVITASDAVEALEIARSEPLALLISDLHMPGRMDGADLCAEIKRDTRLAHLPVLMLLRPDCDEDGERAVRAGADDMLRKPIARQALVEAVNHFLESGLSRGLPRVDITTPVQLRSSLFHAWGATRNISRGGIFVEADCDLTPKSEVALDLTLPDSIRPISPIAEVVWSRETSEQHLAGIGMRFLTVDSDAMRTIDDFISQRLPLRAPKPTLPELSAGMR